MKTEICTCNSSQSIRSGDELRCSQCGKLRNTAPTVPPAETATPESDNHLRKYNGEVDPTFLKNLERQRDEARAKCTALNLLAESEIAAFISERDTAIAAANKVREALDQIDAVFFAPHKDGALGKGVEMWRLARVAKYDALSESPGTIISTKGGDEVCDTNQRPEERGNPHCNLGRRVQ